LYEFGGGDSLPERIYRPFLSPYPKLGDFAGSKVPGRQRSFALLSILIYE